MKHILPLVAVALCILSTSCATIITGTSQRVLIDSEPQGAEIYIDGRLKGTTPSKVRVEKDVDVVIDNGKQIELKYDGYYSDGYELSTELNPVSVLDIICVPFFAIDILTGAIINYDDYNTIVLEPIKEGDTAKRRNEFDELIDEYETPRNDKKEETPKGRPTQSIQL